MYIGFSRFQKLSQNDLWRSPSWGRERIAPVEYDHDKHKSDKQETQQNDD